jgi:pilus assembly protein CpaB
MRAKSTALLMLALGCGLVASIGITQVIAKRNTEPANTGGDTIPIMVATQDIAYGELLGPLTAKMEPWPKSKVPAGALSSMEEADGRRTRYKILEGEPIIEKKLLGKGASARGATDLIPKGGFQVVSVKVDSVSGSGLILPGDRVDVLVYLVSNSQLGIPDTSVRPVVQDIKVFAVNDVVDLEKDKDSKDKSISAKTISLLVTPQQAAKVTLASEMGKIRLIMRNPDDDTHAVDTSAKSEALFGNASASDRQKEDPTLNDTKNGLLELLGQKKVEAPAPAPVPEPEPEPQHPKTYWTVRILHPDGVNEVVLESENEQTENTIFGSWRVSGGNAENPAENKVQNKKGEHRGNKENKPEKALTALPANPMRPPETNAAAPKTSGDNQNTENNSNNNQSEPLNN